MCNHTLTNVSVRFLYLILFSHYLIEVLGSKTDRSQNHDDDDDEKGSSGNFDDDNDHHHKYCKEMSDNSWKLCASPNVHLLHWCVVGSNAVD